MKKTYNKPRIHTLSLDEMWSIVELLKKQRANTAKELGDILPELRQYYKKCYP